MRCYPAVCTSAFAVAATSLLAACGSADDSENGEPSTAPDISSGDPASDPPAAPDPADAFSSFSFQQPAFEVAPGEEWTACYLLPVPEEHRTPDPMYVTGFRSFFGPGTHHYFAYYNGDPPPETMVNEPTPCFDDGPRGSVIDIRSLQYKTGPGPTFGAPEGHGEYFLPEGHAYYMPSGSGYFVTDHHLFNPSPDAITVSGELEFFYAEPEDVTHVLNLLTCTIDRPLIHIEPYSELTVRGTCVATEPIDVPLLASHAHLYLKRFSQYFYDGATTHSEPIYESTDWDSPHIEIPATPLHLEPGQGFTIQCEYENPTDLTITEGIGEAGEMCVGWNLYVRTNDPFNTPNAGGTVPEMDGIGDIAPSAAGCGPFGALPCWR